MFSVFLLLPLLSVAVVFVESQKAVISCRVQTAWACNCQRMCIKRGHYDHSNTGSSVLLQQKICVAFCVPLQALVRFLGYHLLFKSLVCKKIATKKKLKKNLKTKKIEKIFKKINRNRYDFTKFCICHNVFPYMHLNTWCFK